MKSYFDTITEAVNYYKEEEGYERSIPNPPGTKSPDAVTLVKGDGDYACYVVIYPVGGSVAAEEY